MSWIVKRIFSDKSIEYLVEKARPKVDDMVVESMNDYLSSEEFGQYLIGVTDAIYERYSKKFFGAIGGRVRGINAEVDREIAEESPLLGIARKWQKTGKLDAKGAVLSLLLGGFQKKPVMSSRFKKKALGTF